MIGTIRASVRHYFSSNLLWTAEHLAARAGQIEAAYTGEKIQSDPEHRGDVVTSVLAAASFLEAMINELYQDAADGHGTVDDGYIAPLTEETRKAMAQLWRSTDEGFRLRPLEKVQLLLTLAGREPLDRGAQPYQDASLVFQLRNAIAHFQPESLSGDSPARLERALRGKFPDNRLWADASPPWWPNHCLGHGCAAWAARSVRALADALSDEVGLKPHYRRVSRDEWAKLGRRPGDTPAGTQSGTPSTESA